MLKPKFRCMASLITYPNFLSIDFLTNGVFTVDEQQNLSLPLPSYPHKSGGESPKKSVI